MTEEERKPTCPKCCEDMDVSLTTHEGEVTAMFSCDFCGSKWTMDELIKEMALQFADWLFGLDVRNLWKETYKK